MAGRLRAALSTITTAPWRRAPWLLWRRPGVVLTVVASCAVVAASVAAVPLFLSSVGSATVEVQADERCPRVTGATARFRVGPADVVDGPVDPFTPVADRLGPARRWVRLEPLRLTGADPQRRIDASLLARDDVADHIEVLEQTSGDGVWITDRAAERTGLGVGDNALLGGAEVPVVGVYRDVAGTSVDDYWCSIADLVLLEVRGADLVLPPPIVLADRATFARLVTELDVDAFGAWEAPLRAGLDVTEVEGLVEDLACEGDAAPVWCADRRPPIALGRPQDGVRPPLYAQDAEEFVTGYLDSSLPFVVRRARAVQATVGGGIWPMAGLAALAGLGLVAAAAALWFERRRREVGLLTVRGVSPAAIGVKAVLEVALPALLGALVGIAVAYGVVAWIGPSPEIEAAGLRWALVAGGGALLAALSTVGVVVARRTGSHAVRRSRRGWAVRVPWEVLLGAATVVSYARLGEWGVPVGRGASLTRIDVVGLLFPVLFLVTAVALLARVVGLTLRPLRRLSRGWPAALYLGVRRVARHRVAVIGLVAAAAVTAGVLGYATTLNRSLAATLDAKASTFVGSELAVQLPGGAALPPSLAARATEVEVYRRAWLDLGSRESVMVLGIDPATFEPAAFWDDSFADRSLGELLRQLQEPRRDGLVPAVVVGVEVGDGVELTVVGNRRRHLPIAPVTGVRAFPGMSKPVPTVIVDQARLQAASVDGGMGETWIGGERDEVVATLLDAGVGFEERRRATDVADSASFLTVSWTFGFMQSVGVSAGLLALGGAAVYLDARRRDRLLGYAFLRRMGMTGRQHRRALGVELTTSLLLGCWSGLGIALLAAWLAHSRIDPVPGYRPAPLLRPALDVAAGFAVLSVLVVLVAAALAQRRVDRDDPVEVLRAGV